VIRPSVKIYFSGVGANDDIAEVTEHFAAHCPEFTDVKEIGYLDGCCDFYFDDEGESWDLFGFAFLWQCDWGGKIDDLLKLVQHPELIADSDWIEDPYCEVCVDGQWYGGDCHEIFE